MTTTNTLVQSANQTKEVIANMNALAKMICSPIGNNISWIKLLEQIKNPGTNRPIKKLDEDKVDRTNLFNPLTGKWEKRALQDERGRNKETEYTKKTSTTLLPSDGKIRFWQAANPELKTSLGLLFDLRDCDLREGKYVFNESVVTNDKFWLKRQDGAESKQEVQSSVLLEQLKLNLQQAQENNRVPEYNEILARLHHDAVVGVFTMEDTLIERLNALSKKQLVQAFLNKDIPVFIITPTNGVKIYSDLAMANDLIEALSLNPYHPAHILAKGFRQNDLPNEYNVNDLSTFANRDPMPLDELIPLIKKDGEDNRKQDVVLNDYIKKSLKETTYNAHINDAITHLCTLNKGKASNLLTEALNSDSANLNMIMKLISLKVIPNLDKTNRVIGRMADNNYHENKTVGVETSQWSCLVAGILRNDDDLNRLIIDTYPNHLESILASLADIDLKISKHGVFSPIINHDELVKIRAELLIILPKVSRVGHQFQKHEKHLTNDYLYTQVCKVNDINDLIGFYREHRKGDYLNQHRHPVLQGIRHMIFSNPERLYTRSRRGFEDMIEHRLKFLVQQDPTIRNEFPTSTKLLSIYLDRFMTNHFPTPSAPSINEDNGSNLYPST